MPFQCLIACRIQDESLLKDFLSYLLPKVTTMREALEYQAQRIRRAKKTGIFGIQSFSLPDSQNLFWVNIGFGNKLLKKFNADVESIDPAYKRGLAAGSFSLGDPKDSADEGNKNNWVVGKNGREADLFLITASDKKEILEENVEELKNAAARFQIQILYSEIGERLEGDIEHFGFNDGASQPEARGYIDENQTLLTKRLIVSGNEGPDSAEFSAPGKLLLWTGQFVFGYPKQSPSHFRNPIEPSEIEKSEFLKNGSFLVFRRLKQKVREFYDETKILYDELINAGNFEDITYDEFLARLVGRYKDGTPVVFDGQNISNSYISNFNFKSATGDFILADATFVPSVEADPSGLKCPMFAHIRKVNPRDVATDQGAETNTATFRVLRRGIPFGKPYNHENPDDPVNSENRGLFFMSYQTSILNQFERLVTRWMNKDSRPEARTGHDILVGQNNEEGENNVRWCMFTNAAGHGKRLETTKPFVIPTGGGYFFCPSLKTLKSIINT